MRGWGRLAALPAVLSATAILSIPAAADARSSSEDMATVPAPNPQSADAESQRVSADDATGEAVADGVDVVRYAGADPYEQSLEIARALVDAGGRSSKWAVLASGESWAEAAAAGPLAASLGAPVLLVPPGGLQSPAARPDLVEFLKSAGVRRVIIVGGPEVLPNHEPSVLFGLGMLPRNIERVWSGDPAALSVAVAERLGSPAEMGQRGRTVIIASDRSAADAAALGPLAAAGPFPLLLTDPDALDPRITAYLAEHEVTHVVLVGGEAAVAPAVEDAIGTAGMHVTRLAGIDRYHTAALAMDLLAEAPRCAEDAIDDIGLALSERPRLALVAGRLLGPQCIPLLFTDADRLALATQNHLYLYRYRTGIEPNWHLIGDEVTIRPAAIQHPPVRMATVADNPDGGGQHIVVLDEHHRPTRYLLGAGFDGITHLRWTDDRSAISFTGIRDGIPYIYEGVRDGDGAFRETVQGGTRRTYELDLRSEIARPQSRFPSWYAHLAADSWIDPKPSRNREYVVFRMPGEGYAGHSLFALHVTSGEVRRLTYNTTDDTHHVVSSDWLDGGRRLVYTHVEVAQLERPAPGTNPSDRFRAYLYPDSGPLGGECRNVPQQRAHIVDVATGQVHPLPHGGHLIDEPIVSSPNKRYVAIKAYEEYEFAPQRDILQFFYYRCAHDGIGPPSVSVYDISGHEPRGVNEASTIGYDPMWSPDSNYLAFRASAGPFAGHSLFALDAGTGGLTQITRNQSDEHHHIAQHWLTSGKELLYTVQSIALRDAPCHHLSPAQQSPEGVPHIEAHIVNIADETSTELEFAGFVADYWDSGFDLAPGGRHISFTSDSEYGAVGGPDGCGYLGHREAQLFVYDIIAASPRRLTVGHASTSGTLWSPDGRYLSYRGHEVTRRGRHKPTYSILDTRDGSTWRLPLSDIFEAEARLNDVAWTPDGSRLLYNVELYDLEYGDYRDTTYSTAIADVETKEIVRLSTPENFGGELRFFGFSSDGRAVIHGDEHTYGFGMGKVMLHDVKDGKLLGVYDSYAASEAGESVFDNPDDITGDNILEDFRFSATWSAAGIFATGEYYLWHHSDF